MAKIDINFAFLLKKTVQELCGNWSHPACGDQLVVNDSKFSTGQLIFHIIATVLPCGLVLSCTQVAAELCALSLARARAGRRAECPLTLPGCGASRVSPRGVWTLGRYGQDSPPRQKNS